jgi:pimeloyl-ACP methyl ester carboxylesterase
MSTFVLVHGSSHGAWCWHKVVTRLEAQGHNAVAFDLPAHGIDTTPYGDVTLDDYVESTIEVIDEQDEPVILVGHSLAGMVITGAAEERPAAIDTLVYLSAFLPRNGASLLEMAEAEAYAESVAGQHMIIDEEQGVVDLPDDILREAFYADCSEEDVVLARSLLRPDPLAPGTDPINTTEEGFGNVRRIYIETIEDKAVPPEFQASMYTDRPCEEVYTLETSHSPFFSAPDRLVEHLFAV